jgi:signal transduction histidine kinase
MKQVGRTSFVTNLRGVLAGVSTFLLLYIALPIIDGYTHVFSGFSEDIVYDIRRHESHTIVIILLSIISAMLIALYTSSIMSRREQLLLRVPHRFDYFFTVLGIIKILFLIVLIYIKFRYHPVIHIFLYVCAFSAILHLWTTTLIRINTHSLSRTVYWHTVLDKLPAHNFSGSFVVAAVGLTTAFFMYSCIEFIFNIVQNFGTIDTNFAHWIQTFIITLCAPYTVLVMIAVFCRDILRRTADKERLTEEKFIAERARAELITNVTHDIRTPLTSIISYVDLISKLNIDNSDLREYINVLENTSSRLKFLVNDLLEASKASSGNIELTMETIDLTEIVGQVAGNFDDAFAVAELSYEGPDSDDSVFIYSDGGHLCRVLENLFSNAVKYSLPGTRLYADITTYSETAELGIKNISKDKLNIAPAELMQQFVRGEQARSTEGSGLGLFIADRLTELMGGKLSIEISGDLFEAILTFPRSSVSQPRSKNINK